MLTYHKYTTGILNNHNLIMLYTVSFTIACISMSMNCIHFAGERCIMIVNFFIFAVSLIFISRQSIFGLPKDLEYIIPGMVLGGLSNGAVVVTCMPELLIYGGQAATEGTTQ